MNTKYNEAVNKKHIKRNKGKKERITVNNENEKVSV